MTQEEKAKAYDEAMKRAEAAINIAADKDLVKGVAITIFPELRESEDERIKKAILSALRGGINTEKYLEKHGTNYGEVEDWLEKQKEQKPVNLAEEEPKKMTKYLRFGEIPENGKSKIWRGEECIGEEEGVSVYEIKYDKEKNIFSVCLPFPFHRDTLDTLCVLTKYDNRPCYTVTGEYVGKGTDGEPLISNVQIEEEFPKIISDEKMEQMGEEISKVAVDTINKMFSKILEKEPDDKKRKIQACICYALANVPNEKIKNFGVSLQDCLDYVVPVNKGLREEPLELEKAAEEYANKEHPDEPCVGTWGTGDYEPPVDREYLREIAKDAFNAGARWMEEQGETNNYKPTKEQIEYLSKAIYILGEEGDCKTAAVLNELRKDLKKL